MCNNRCVIGICFTAVLSGCSDSTNLEDEFINVLNSDDDKRFCIGQRVLGVDIWGEKDGDQYLVNDKVGYNEIKEADMMLSKLVEKGYVESGTIKLRVNYQTKDAHKLTEKGRKYFIWGKPLCVGDRTATSIIEYTAPTEMAGMTFTKVDFTYDLVLNEFVSDLDLEEKLRNYGMDSMGMVDLEMDGKGNATFVQTNKGWRLEEGW